jgi:NAD(P)H dehydrogenase (quinone)
MIVVTGASGHLGRLVIDSLLDRVTPEAVVAAVRTPEKVDDLAARGVVVRRLDYDEPATARAALAGAERVLLISASEVGRRVPQHAAVIDAAAAEGVAQFAYTSILHADRNPIVLAAEHRATESLIHDAGLPATLLRNGWYLENYTENLAPAIEHGTIVGSAGAGRVAAAGRADFAAAAAAVLTTEGHAGASYELAGHAFTMAELAAVLSDVLGREITYTDLPPVAHRDMLLSAGLPAAFAELLVDADRNVAAGNLFETTSDLEALLGRSPATLETALRAVLASAHAN